MAKKPVFSKIPFLVTEVLGLGVSSYLFAVSAKLIGEGLPCPRSKWFACESAVQGPYSHIGPFSVAAMGVIYYVVHLALTGGMRDRTAQVLKCLAVAGGLVFVAWLRSLELIYLKKICPWCWGVAALTLIHAVFSYGLLSPPLPRLRWPAITGAVVGGFLVLVGLVTVVELAAGTGKWMLQQGFGDEPARVESKSPEDGKKSEPKAIVQATPKKTPVPEPTPTPVSETPAPSPSPSPTPKPAPKLDPEPEIPDSPDVKVLRARGWRHAGSGESVVRAVKARPPVLMLCYDPICPDCHALITRVLDSDDMNLLPVTRIAIQESMLTGQIDTMVDEKPTMLLFGADGQILHKHVGSRITPKELAETIRKALESKAQP